MKIKCSNKKCRYEWDYNGLNTFYACCPRCHSSINIKKNKIVKNQSIEKEVYKKNE